MRCAACLVRLPSKSGILVRSAFEDRECARRLVESECGFLSIERFASGAKSAPREGRVKLDSVPGDLLLKLWRRDRVGMPREKIAS